MNKILPYLQIGRGIASLIVVFHHITAAEVFYFGACSFAGLFKAGWNAVDFFFVLSGFIIYYIHRKDLGHRTEWPHYMTKRLTRIYPIYWFLAIISLAVIIIGHDHISRSGMSALSSDPSYILKSFFLIPQPNDPFLTVAWSLCYEVFFYLVFGAGIYFNKKVLWIFPLIYVAAKICQVLIPGFVESSQLFSFLSSNYHVEFLLGILTAYCLYTLQEQKELSSRLMPFVRWIWIVGLLFFAVTWYLSLTDETDFGKFSLYSRLCYGAASALIILGIAQWKQIGSGIFSRFFLLLGDASYSLYLVHPLVLALLFKLITHAGMHGKIKWMNYCLYGVASGCCVLTGIVLHKKIEKPMLATLNRRLQKKVSYR